MLIGFLRKYKQPLTKDEIAALVAREYGAETIFFNPDSIDFKQKLIHGLSYHQGSWQKRVSYFPDVVYNDIPTRKEEGIYKQLEEEGIPFTTHRLGRNKLSIQEKMSQDAVLSAYAIETTPYNDAEQFLAFLDKHKKVFLKPNRGHKGLGIYRFDQAGDRVIYQNFDGKITNFSLAETKIFVAAIPEVIYHHLQPQITSATQDGRPYVIRSYVGRTGDGSWKTMFHYAAISLNGNNVVNVSRGSSFSYIEMFLENNFGDQHTMMLKTLNRLGMTVAERVQSFVEPQIDALGIDLGITPEGKIYIYEVNSYPGTRPFEAFIEKHAIPYAIHLASRK
ncbi:YheC/YheD family protein [Paenibacillus sp. GCM10027626]|uniref:YheC/YheD family protein n=1 Tax=Paenibacillus sp. GCM10027626 TaxID=3273411 RepID=UPI00362A9575